MSDNALGRTLRLLDVFAERGGEPLRFSALQAALDDLNAASASRLCKQLLAEGVLLQDEAGYRPGPRLTVWHDGIPAPPSLAERALPALEAISREHRATTLCLERRGQRVAAVAKALHEDAPSLMPTGRSFPPRLPYFGCVLLLDPDRRALRRWVQSQLVEVDPAVQRRVDEGVQVTRFFLEHGYYRDQLLWPGQLRLAVALPERRGLIGAAVIADSIDAAGEAALLTALREAAAQL